MATPMSDLEAQLDSLRADAEFVRLASQLRPRIGGIIQWQAQGEETELAKRFMKANSSTPEAVYSSLLVRLVACFEKYLRNTFAVIVNRKSEKARNYDELAETIGSRNQILTGRLLASQDNPRDHLTFDVEEVIANLASCKKGSAEFRLNPLAFSATLVGVAPLAVERAFENVGVKEWWDKLGADPKMIALLGTKGAHATGKQSKERLKELSRWRNHLAHGGDGEIVISESQLADSISFIASFSAALEKVVKTH
jgi:RiboL-PSP-HEPN